MDVEVKLQDITKEKSVNLSYTRNDRCDPCNGTGQTSNSTHSQCGHCGGRGVMYRNMGIMQIERACGYCNGS